MMTKHIDAPLPDDTEEVVPDAHLLRKLYADGKAKYQDRSFEAAEQIFLRLLELDPKNSGAWYYVGRSRYERNDIGGAIAALQKSVR